MNIFELHKKSNSVSLKDGLRIIYTNIKKKGDNARLARMMQRVHKPNRGVQPVQCEDITAWKNSVKEAMEKSFPSMKAILGLMGTNKDPPAKKYTNAIKMYANKLRNNQPSTLHVVDTCRSVSDTERHSDLIDLKFMSIRDGMRYLYSDPRLESIWVNMDILFHIISFEPDFTKFDSTHEYGSSFPITTVLDIQQILMEKFYSGLAKTRSRSRFHELKVSKDEDIYRGLKADFSQQLKNENEITRGRFIEQRRKLELVHERELDNMKSVLKGKYEELNALKGKLKTMEQSNFELRDTYTGIIDRIKEEHKKEKETLVAENSNLKKALYNFNESQKKWIRAVDNWKAENKRLHSKIRELGGNL